ncbi:MAG: FkbM family methyltransferase [Gemmatimonadaceae bacterium]
MGVSYALRFEAANLAFLSERLRPGMTVFDVGANRGQMALFFSRGVGPTGGVVAFEPAPTPFRSLRRNVELNGLRNVELRCVAVSDSAGTAHFHFDESAPTQGHLIDASSGRTGGACEVEMTTLDHVVATTGAAPDLIKIDVEGAAAGVLRGARRLLETGAPALYLEMHGRAEQEAVRDLLLPLGFVAKTLDGRTVPDPTAGWFSPLWCYRPASAAQ